MHIKQVDAANAPAHERGLATLLLDCVEGGATIGFLNGLSLDDAIAWWRGRLADPHAIVWVASEDDDVIGTVSLLPARYPASTHRAEVSKLLVRRDARGRGCASALMATLESRARELGRSLLLLDTETGSDADRIYEKWGWHRIGTIDDFARDPSGRLRPASFLIKRLDMVGLAN